MTMRALLILVTIFFSANAFAQSAPPKVGGKLTRARTICPRRPGAPARVNKAPNDPYRGR
jgi:hypothetical protein